MKHIFNTLTVLATLAAAPVMTGCSDFLDILPLNETVEENFWTEKADVQSVLNSCYSAFETQDVMKRMFVWGEVRSDNVVAGGNIPYGLQQIVEEKILETNDYVKWQPFYQIINRCNVVISYAPKVVAVDPNYTMNEARANIAEATFLRTLAYFYLARTFREVPYTTEPSDTDDDIEGHYRIKPTHINDLLPILIQDLLNVRPDALRLYPEDSNTGLAANTSRVTTCAIDALLADLYLWNKQYQECVECCDRVIAYKWDRYEELKEEYPDQANQLYVYYDKYPLQMETPAGNEQGMVYNRIFGTGNAFESIFELYFLDDQTQQNLLVADFFGNSSRSAGQFGAYSGLFSQVYDDKNDVFRKTDCRVPEGMQESSTSYAIRKYARQSCSFKLNKSTVSAPQVSGSLRSNNYSNWIIYRYTDVMLMKAEAEVELNKFDDAFQLVSATYNRANNFNEASQDTLVFSNYASISSMRELVLSERRRELMFEGKRWYDMVRYCLRMGDNDYIATNASSKQRDRVTAVITLLRKPDALFWPYAESEIDANPYLHQNPAYNTNENSQK